MRKLLEHQLRQEYKLTTLTQQVRDVAWQQYNLQHTAALWEDEGKTCSLAKRTHPVAEEEGRRYALVEKGVVKRSCLTCLKAIKPAGTCYFVHQEKGPDSYNLSVVVLGHLESEMLLNRPEF